MKKIFTIVLLCAISVIARSQNIQNNTQLCSFKVTTFCYSTASCTLVQNCGTITANPGLTALATCNPACGVGNAIGYRICCPNSTTCAVVNDGGTIFCTPIPTSATLTCSADCANVHIHYVGGVLTIDP